MKTPSIAVREKGISPLLSFLRSEQNRYSSCALLTTSTVHSLYGKQVTEQLAPLFPLYPILLPDGEEAKQLSFCELCWNTFYEKGLDRQSLVISLGGGTISDIAGFAASSYMRGIDLIHIPTTLLGMVDAAIGGKGAINLGGGKNLIGSFYAPKYVMISLEYLATLPEKEYRAGLAEVIKYGVIADPSLIDFLEKEHLSIGKRDPFVLKKLVEVSVAIKSAIVEEDPKEKGRRALLNWGHTFAHAIEAVSQFKGYTHGEAVSIGMQCAAHASYLGGYSDRTLSILQEKICKKMQLPTTLPKSTHVEQILNIMSKDKKASQGKLCCILARKIGDLFVAKGLSPSLIKEAILANLE